MLKHVVLFSCLCVVDDREDNGDGRGHVVDVETLELLRRRKWNCQLNGWGEGKSDGLTF